MHTCLMKNSQVMLWELGQVDIGLGTLVTTNERITQAIEPIIITQCATYSVTRPSNCNGSKPNKRFNQTQTV